MKRLAILALALASPVAAEDGGASLDKEADALFAKHWPAVHRDPLTANVTQAQFRALTYWGLLAYSFGYCQTYAQPGDKQAWKDAIDRLGLDEPTELRFYSGGLQTYAKGQAEGLTDNNPETRRVRYCSTELAVARQKLEERVVLSPPARSSAKQGQ